MALSKSGFPPTVDIKLPGWQLFWAEMEFAKASNGLEPLRTELPGKLRRITQGRPLSEHPTVQSVRSLFRNAGCDPTRHRPSSEALARRVAKGEPLPAILPVVDLNNVWSVELLVPCCVINPTKVSGTFTLRRGQSGEVMESLRGSLNLEGKPVLADDRGPFGTPITDSERVKVTKAAGTFWLVAYLPQNVVSTDVAAARLQEITDRVPQARVVATSE
jgi:DNA/RNA-binding domain of Phe-tRNA-synthetase-like protein